MSEAAAQTEANRAKRKEERTKSKTGRVNETTIASRQLFKTIAS